MTSSFKGVEVTVRALRRISPEMRRKITDALDKGAEEIASKARSYAPVDDGELKGAVEVIKGAGSGFGLSAFRQDLAAAAPDLVRRIGIFPSRNGGRAWYARWVEFGTARNPAGARPFLRPAFRFLRKRVEGRVRRAVNAAIRDVARRGR